MKFLKRIILFIIVIAALFGISKLFKNNNLATNVDDSKTTLSLDEIGGGKINDGVIVLSQKDSEKVIKETSDIDFTDGTIVIKFKKKTPKSLKKLEKDEIVLIRPSEKNDKDNNPILAEGLTGIVQAVESDSIILTSANIDDVFSELVIDTALIQNQISESSVYLADGVTLETPEVYLASSDKDVKFNLVNGKNDGAPKIEKLSINVEDKKLGDISLSGDIEITDLTMDYKLDYKKGRTPEVDAFKFQILGDISSNLGIGYKKSTDDLKEPPKDIFEKLKKDSTLAYIFFKLGAVPVEVGVGNIISPSLGVGVFINYDIEGELSIETSLVFDYSDNIKAGIELVKENNESKIKLLDKEEKPKVGVELNSLEINGESQIYGELEAAAVVLKINLASLAVDSGIDAEGKLALTRSINLSDDELNLDDFIDGSLNIDWVNKFKAAVDILKAVNLDLQYNKEFSRTNLLSFPKVVEFDGRTVDLSGLKEISVIESDINEDKIDDRIAIYGTSNEWGSKYIVIFNGKDNKVLTTIDCDIVDSFLIETVDINGDGKKEIHVGSYYGGTGAGSRSYLLEYKDRTYKRVPIRERGENDSYADIKLIDGFKLQLTQSTLGIDEVVNLTEAQREEYTKNKIYNSNGKLITKERLSNFSTPLVGVITDIDNDGELEYLDQYSITDYYSSSRLYCEIYVYKYIDGELVLRDVVIQPGVQGYTEDYVESEEFVMKEETFETPADGIIYMVVESVEDGYVDADKVEWVTIQESNGYSIEGIDGDIGRYKLSDNCKFTTMTMKPDDPEDGTSADFSGFKSAIDDMMKAIPGIAKARLCVAKIENGEITKISTVYLP